MNHKIKLDYIIFWSSLLTVLAISHKAGGILTDSNELHCTHIQCPTKCPEDSYLKSAQENEENDFEDYEDEFLGHHDPYIEEIGNFEEMPPEVELHDDILPQHLLKERQRREVFFQEDIERCCGDQKCVCTKCPDVPKCAADHVAVEVHEGHAVPGNCCSIFRCIKKEPCQLGIKQSWWTNKCRKCSCFGENELCEQICPEEEIVQSCYSVYWQKPMLNGAFWKEGSCTSCSCEQGERRCFSPICPKLQCQAAIKIEDECCPKCLLETKDESTEITNGKEQDFEQVVDEEYSTESTTIETFIMGENKEVNRNSNKDDSHNPVVVEVLLNETQASTTEFNKPSTSSYIAHTILQETTTTLAPESAKNSSSIESYTSPSSASSTLSPILTMFSTAITSTEDTVKAVYDTTTEDTQTVSDNGQDSTTSSSATEEEEFSTMERAETNSEQDNSYLTSTDYTEERTTTDVNSSPSFISTTEKAKSNSKQDSSNSTSTDYTEKRTTTDATSSPFSISATETSPESSFLVTTDSTFESNNTTLIDESSKNSKETSKMYSTSVATESTTSTTDTESPLNASLVLTSTTFATTPAEDLTSFPTTSTEYTSSIVRSTEHPSSSSTSTVHLTTTTTSTTSSPYSTNRVLTTTSGMEDTSTTSSTSAPEPLSPLFQSYGDMTSEEGSPNTKNKMRKLFDEIDYVVMIGLFIGSLLCISLGLIIRHTKNRKKMYSSVPNSEALLITF